MAFSGVFAEFHRLHTHGKPLLREAIFIATACRRQGRAFGFAEVCTLLASSAGPVLVHE